MDDIKEETNSVDEIDFMTSIPTETMKEIKKSLTKNDKLFEEGCSRRKYKFIKKKKSITKEKSLNVVEDSQLDPVDSMEEQGFKSSTGNNAQQKSEDFSNKEVESEMRDDIREEQKRKKYKRIRTEETENTSPNQRIEVDSDQDSSMDEELFKFDIEKSSGKKQMNPSSIIADNTRFSKNRQQQNSRKFSSSDILSSSDEADEQVYDDLNNYGRSEDNGKFNLTTETADIEELLKVIEDEEILPNDTRRKLRRLRIQLRHTPPPQHLVENSSGARVPTMEQRKILEKLAPMKYGKFTPEEDNIIIKNWKSFCKHHDWDKRDVKPFLYMRHKDAGFIAKFPERQKFTQYLAYKLPYRTLYSVYWRFRNLYHPHLQTRYTDQEDTLIKAHMENPAKQGKNVRKFAELAKILNRTRASVWRRWRLLNKMKKIDHGEEWNMRLAKRFLRNLMVVTLNENVDQLKDVEFPDIIWSELSKKLKIQADELKQFWYTRLHIQLFSKEPIYLNDVKIKLIEYLYVKGISDSREIQWSEIVKDFDGMTPMFLSDIFNRLVGDDTFQDRNWSDILEYLYHVKKPKIQNEPKDKRLRRIAYEKGNLVLLDGKSETKTG